jgi:hypothetical protein
MDRLTAHRLEAADESITEVGAAAAANRVGPPFLDRHVCRTLRLSHQHPSGARSLSHRVPSQEAMVSAETTRFLPYHTICRII